MVTRTYEVRTNGCQMNVHDSERIAGMLNHNGASAGIPKASQLPPHSIRRSMATLALNEGVPLAAGSGTADD